jgi:hypothetical protein
MLRQVDEAKGKLSQAKLTAEMQASVPPLCSKNGDYRASMAQRETMAGHPIGAIGRISQDSMQFKTS